MLDPLHPEVQRHFSMALDLKPEERPEYLRGIDPDIRSAVERLLAAHDAGGTIVPIAQQSIFEEALRDLEARRSVLEFVPGQCVGLYKIISLIGEGGFGQVYLAERARPPVLKVAIKVIKPGMDTRRVLDRFSDERDILARMQHPNIARVLDSGETDHGRPYFVMEYIVGQPITDYCDAKQLSVEERSQLFIDVCSGVLHAHQKPIMHGDIKPSNVLVTTEGDRPVPKIIDFGIARALDQPPNERTRTKEQRHFRGTPQYMSPEQAGDEHVDTRSDIYSLGVLFYELLVGERPFDEQVFRSGDPDKIQRIIREVDPPNPSTRFSRLNGDSKKIASDRQTDSKSLSRRLRGISIGS